MPTEKETSVTWTLFKGESGWRKPNTSTPPSEHPLTAIRPPTHRSAFRKPWRIPAPDPTGTGPATPRRSAGLLLQMIPATPDSCEDGCHFCEGPETD